MTILASQVFWIATTILTAYCANLYFLKIYFDVGKASPNL
jgi:hypothetical protein